MAPDLVLLAGCVSSLATSAAMVAVHLARQRTERRRVDSAARLEQERLALAWRVFERSAAHGPQQDVSGFLAAIVRPADPEPLRTPSADGAGAQGGP